MRLFNLPPQCLGVSVVKPPLLLLLLLILLRSPAPAADTTITLAWDYPTNELSASLTFKLYHSDSLLLPAAQWSVLTNIPGTTLQVTLPVTISQHYFYLTASNWWGESDPSNVASTPAPPRSGKLTIHRGSTVSFSPPALRSQIPRSQIAQPITDH